MKRSLCVIVAVGVLAVGVVWIAAKASVFSGLSGLLLAQADPAGLAGLTGEATTQPSASDTPAAEATVPASPAQQPPPEDQNANPPGPSDLQAQVPTPEAAEPAGVASDKAVSEVGADLLRAKTLVSQGQVPEAIALFEQVATAVIGTHLQTGASAADRASVKDALDSAGVSGPIGALSAEPLGQADPDRSKRLVQGWARLWAGQALLDKGDPDQAVEKLATARRLASRKTGLPALKLVSRLALGRICRARALAVQATDAEAAKTLHWQALLCFAEAFREGYVKIQSLAPGMLEEALGLLREEIDALGIREWGCNWMRLAMKGSGGAPDIEQALIAQVSALGGSVADPTEPGGKTALPNVFERLKYPSEELVRRAAQYDEAKDYVAAIGLYEQAAGIAETSWHKAAALHHMIVSCYELETRRRLPQYIQNAGLAYRGRKAVQANADACLDVAVNWVDPDKAFLAMSWGLSGYCFTHRWRESLGCSEQLLQAVSQSTASDRRAMAELVRLFALDWNDRPQEVVSGAVAMADQYLETGTELAQPLAVKALRMAGEISLQKLKDQATGQRLLSRLEAACPGSLQEPIGAAWTEFLSELQTD